MGLATYRKTEGRTLRALADLIGVQSDGYVSDIEKGKKPASAPVAVRIMRATGIKLPPIDTLNDDEIALLEKMQAA